jgi:ParB family chromosome partitioning protein
VEERQTLLNDIALERRISKLFASVPLIGIRDFTACIEQNILLSLDSVPFDKTDATLVPEAENCAECPKRTGFNTLLFGEMSHRDQCTDAACRE